MRCRSLTVLAASLVLALFARPAQAQYPTRLYVGPSFSPFWNGTAATVDGKFSGEGETFDFGLELGASRHLAGEILAARGTLLVAAWTNEYARASGQRRGHFDACLGPEIQIPAYKATFRFFVPIGYSNAWIRTRPGRAVRDDYTGGHGVTFGVVAAVDIWGEHNGGYVGVAYAGRYNWFLRESTLIANSAARAVEHYRFVTHAVVLSGGYAFRL
jgi:hypothetical protein